MNIKNLITSAATILSVSAFGALAEPALIYDLGGKFDKSFNEMAFSGAERWKADTGGNYREIELSSEAQREQALRRFAENGNNPIVMAGFAFSTVLGEVAKDYPDTRFAVIDGYVPDQSNVLNIGFTEHTGSYLVGMMAAMKSETGTVGFIGGMDIPIIDRFGCGYVQGVKAVNPDAKVIYNMTGSTPSAWADPVKGGELTKAQISQGADIVYHAAGGTGVGVLQAAADAGILAIGVDKNQNHLHPGSVLTSMVKRVDTGVYDAFKAGADLAGGFATLSLANGGISYAMDEHNVGLVTKEMVDAVEEAKAQIISGELKVHDYLSDSSCPVK